MLLGNKAKAAWPLRAATLKQQPMIKRHSGEWQASLKPALEDTYAQAQGPFEMTNNLHKNRLLKFW